uniref:Gfo/Idh/MocA family protein n=1 Tax=Nereida sp. TaxID=2736090 RepID=UPI003F69B0E8
MLNIIRWGILGASKFALEQMAPAIHLASGAKLVALATSSNSKALAFQALQSDLRIHDSYEALLADPEIDAVYVPLPNHLHIEWTLKGLDAGKHVLCEKPLAMNASDFDQVIQRRNSTGLLAAEAYMILHHPQWHKAKELYEAGRIGKLLYVDGIFTYDNSADPDNIRNKPDTGGGSLPDIGGYTFGSARFVTGEEPISVDAQIKRENGVDVFAHVTADFPSFRYNSVTSMRMFPRQYMAFHGDKGVMKLNCPFNPSVFGQAELTLERAGMVTET